MEQKLLTGIFNRLGDIRGDIREIKKEQLNTTKNIFTLPEAANFTGFMKARLYKATRKNELPYYKSHGRVFFKRIDLENWMLQNRVDSESEGQTSALNSIINK